MPATRATASTSPLVMAPEAIFEAVSDSIRTRQRATARRWVASLAVTSTMRARPSGSRWVNSDADILYRLARCGAEYLRRGRSLGRQIGRAQVDPAACTCRSLGERPQPPIWLIERPGRTKLTWPIRWPAHF